MQNFTAGLCETPPNIVNGRTSVGAMKVGSQIIYSCNKGYYMEGQLSRTCVLESGVGTYWDGVIPTCNGKLAILTNNI